MMQQVSSPQLECCKQSSYPSGDDPQWRVHMPRLCYWCVRRLIAGALFDQADVPTVWPAQHVNRIRHAFIMAEDFLASLYGET